MNFEQYGYQFTEDEAIKIYNSKIWEKMNYIQLFKLQMFQSRLCIPFEKFQEATEKVLGRPVWTHEFALPDLLIKEYLCEIDKPDLTEVFDKLVNLVGDRNKIVILD